MEVVFWNSGISNPSLLITLRRDDNLLVVQWFEEEAEDAVGEADGGDDVEGVLDRGALPLHRRQRL